MQFFPDTSYHVYNRGNNRQQIFFDEGNYLFFLEKLRKHLKPVCDILCWCLMPNHFHLLINANEVSCQPQKGYEPGEIQELHHRIRIITSSYSQAINKRNKWTGSLFQQKTKAKPILPKHKNDNYLVNAFHYCHQNPKRAGLVKKIEDWPFSSFPDYCDFRKDDLCNHELLFRLTGLNKATFYEDSYKAIEGSG